MPMASAQSYCTEATRAAALASHSAASLAAAAGFCEVARLLRSSEALARAATAALLALPRPETRGHGSGGSAPDGDVKMTKKRRSKKKKGKEVGTENVNSGPEEFHAANGVPVAASAPPAASALSAGAGEFVPGRAARVLASRPSRERSPRGAFALASTSPSAPSLQTQAFDAASTNKFTVGQAVVLVDLVSRGDLVGKCGVVKSFDSATSRYAVCLGAAGESVKVLEGNLKPTIFGAGVGVG